MYASQHTAMGMILNPGEHSEKLPSRTANVLAVLMLSALTSRIMYHVPMSSDPAKRTGGAGDQQPTLATHSGELNRAE
jgi:hypothetical protein